MQITGRRLWLLTTEQCIRVLLMLLLRLTVICGMIVTEWVLATTVHVLCGLHSGDMWRWGVCVFVLVCILLRTTSL